MSQYVSPFWFLDYYPPPIIPPDKLFQKDRLDEIWEMLKEVCKQKDIGVKMITWDSLGGQDE